MYGSNVVVDDASVRSDAGRPLRVAIGEDDLLQRALAYLADVGVTDVQMPAQFQDDGLRAASGVDLSMHGRSPTMSRQIASLHRPRKLARPDRDTS